MISEYCMFPFKPRFFLMLSVSLGVVIACLLHFFGSFRTIIVLCVLYNLSRRTLYILLLHLVISAPFLR